MHVGNRIKQIIEIKKLKQKDIVKATDYSPAYISELLKAESCPTDTLEKVVINGLGVSMSYFYSDDNADIGIYDNDKLAELIRDIGIEYLVLCKELKDENISPSELRMNIESFKKLGLLKNE